MTKLSHSADILCRLADWLIAWYDWILLFSWIIKIYSVQIGSQFGVWLSTWTSATSGSRETWTCHPGICPYIKYVWIFIFHVYILKMCMNTCMDMICVICIKNMYKWIIYVHTACKVWNWPEHPSQPQNAWHRTSVKAQLRGEALIMSDPLHVCVIYAIWDVRQWIKCHTTWVYTRFMLEMYGEEL